MRVTSASNSILMLMHPRKQEGRVSTTSAPYSNNPDLIWGSRSEDRSFLPECHSRTTAENAEFAEK